MNSNAKKTLSDVFPESNSFFRGLVPGAAVINRGFVVLTDCNCLVNGYHVVTAFGVLGVNGVEFAIFCDRGVVVEVSQIVD